MLAANFNKSLVGMMFHADFKQHLRALDMLIPFAEADLEALVSNLDLLLKWMTLRFFETNPSVNIKAGLWIRIDSIRIRIQHFCSIRIQHFCSIRIQFRIQATVKQNFRRKIFSQIFLKSKFESNQIKNTGVIHQILFKK
jgi:hypothetical protein